ncbi:hypothetical protein HD554DRAFT_2327354 [Boletus coccyginus]|nr:hypothetical protein HD554DRAFT_2327354 [Boletus coccyginus]
MFKRDCAGGNALSFRIERRVSDRTLRARILNDYGRSTPQDSNGHERLDSFNDGVFCALRQWTTDMMTNRTDVFYRDFTQQAKKSRSTPKTTFFGGRGKGYATPKQQGCRLIIVKTDEITQQERVRPERQTRTPNEARSDAFRRHISSSPSAQMPGSGVRSQPVRFSGSSPTMLSVGPPLSHAKTGLIEVSIVIYSFCRFQHRRKHLGNCHNNLIEGEGFAVEVATCQRRCSLGMTYNCRPWLSIQRSELNTADGTLGLNFPQAFGGNMG